MALELVLRTLKAILSYGPAERGRIYNASQELQTFKYHSCSGKRKSGLSPEGNHYPIGKNWWRRWIGTPIWGFR
jgi:hypothetical protein